MRSRRTLATPLLKAYLCLSVLITCLQALCDPLTIAWQILAVSGPGGGWFTGVLIATTVLCLGDVVINDVIDERMSLPFANRQRHQLYWLMAVLLMALVLMAVRWRFESLAALRFLLEAVMAIVIAVSDTTAKRRERMRWLNRSFG